MALFPISATLIMKRNIMARREGVNKRNRSLSKKDHRRRENTKVQKKLIIIACEGTETEPGYFRAFFNKLKEEKAISPHSFVIAPHGHTNPSGVLEDLLVYKGQSGETYKDFDEKWIVIDRDEKRTNGGGHSLEDYNDAAIKNAKRLDEGTAGDEVQKAGENPITQVYKIVEQLVQLLENPQNSMPS